VAIGNGTASRETDKLAGELIAALQEGGAPRVQKVMVSEAVLRSRGGSNPLDASGVHPEAYPVVDRSDVLRSLRPEPFADARFGVVIVKDLLAELALRRPGCAPGRPGPCQPTGEPLREKDAREVVKTGDVVNVRVVEVDAVRKRIALTTKLDAPLPAPADRSRSAAGSLSRKDAARGAAPVAGSMAAAFAKLRQGDSAL